MIPISLDMLQSIALYSRVNVLDIYRKIES